MDGISIDEQHALNDFLSELYYRILYLNVCMISIFPQLSQPFYLETTPLLDARGEGRRSKNIYKHKINVL